MNCATRLSILLVISVILAGCSTTPVSKSADNLRLNWTNNLLVVSGTNIPGHNLSIWYLEAFCGTAAHNQSWDKTKIPHQTRLLEASAGGDYLKFETTVKSGVEMQHTVRARSDEIEFEYSLHNPSAERVDIQWFQPACIRVGEFTGRNQTNFIERSFIFTRHGLTLLSETGRTEEALYRGGQVFLPDAIPAIEANPRPLASLHPVNGLIGCFSADNKQILATASDQTHELFEGVYVCLHSDPHVGGLQPGETRKFRAKVYLIPNDVRSLLQRYHTDFPAANKNAKVSF